MTTSGAHPWTNVAVIPGPVVAQGSDALAVTDETIQITRLRHIDGDAAHPGDEVLRTLELTRVRDDAPVVADGYIKTVVSPISMAVAISLQRLPQPDGRIDSRARTWYEGLTRSLQLAAHTDGLYDSRYPSALGEPWFAADACAMNDSLIAVIGSASGLDRNMQIGHKADGVIDSRYWDGTPDAYAPEWDGAPTTASFTAGLGGTFDLSSYASDPDSGTLTFSLDGTAYSGISIGAVTGILAVDVIVAAGTYPLTVRVTDPDLLWATHALQVVVSPAAAAGFPLFTVYSALVTALGGTPIPASNTRYWDRPVYPAAGTVYTSIAALNTAIAAASYGTTLRLQNGTYANATINCGVDGVTVAAQTRGGVNLSGNSVINVTGDADTVLGFNFTGPYSTQNCVDVTGTDAVIAYCTISIIARGTAGTPGYTQVKNLINAFGARTRVCYCTESGYRGAGRFVEVLNAAAPYPTYCRIDHNRVTDHWCAVDTGGAELYKVGQAQYDVDYYALLDNNYVYRWGNNAGTSGPNSEREQTSIKSSGNIITQNVYEECRGSVNLRNAWDCAVYGNVFLGGMFPDAGGVGMFGRNHLIACNAFLNLNAGGNAQTAALRVGNGNDTTDDYWAAQDCEFSFNTVYNCLRPVLFSPLTDRAVVPDDNKFYNNAIDINTANVAIAVVTAADADTDTVWAGNIVEPPVGRTATGITAAVPALSLANGMRYAAVAGNCDGAAQAGYSALITVDVLGQAIGTDIGCVQGYPDRNVWQAIIDGAGATA